MLILVQPSTNLIHRNRFLITSFVKMMPIDIISYIVYVLLTSAQIIDGFCHCLM